jgi:hypothetical protein
MSQPMIHLPEDRVAALADEALIRQHYSDELSVNELIGMANQGEELLSGWARLPKAEREKFLAERDAVVQHAAGITRRRPDQVGVLLRDAWKKAVARWRGVEPKLLALR